MNLNLFDRKNKNNNLINEFIEELKTALKNIKNEGKDMNENVLDEYNLYERRKIFLDNKSWKGNDIVWVMDDKTVYLAEHGNGGPYSISEIDLPSDAKVGEVYEKIEDKYILNTDITSKLKEII